MFLGLFKKRVKVVRVKRTKLKKTKVKKTKARKPKTTIPQVVGKVTHYFPHVKAGVILVTKGKIALGDRLQFKGHTTDFKQKITSMQVNNAPIKAAKPKDEVGLLVKSRVRHNDIVYKL
jgi:putative protease